MINAPTLSDADYPALFQSADRASVSGQRSYARLVKWDLILVVAAAVLAAIAAFLPADLEPDFAMVTALTLLGGLVIKLIHNSRRGDRDWFDGRAVADAVKSETWLYLMHVEPYDNPATADEAFLAEMQDVLVARPELHHEVGRIEGDGEQITSRMRELRQLELDQRLKLYVEARLDDQIAWYRKRTRANQGASSRYFWASLLAQGLAFVIAILRPVLVAGSLNLVAPFAVLATALAAWSQFRGHDELAKAYALAYHELVTARSRSRTVSTPDQLSRMVRDAETILARERTTWVAKRADVLPHKP